MYKPKIVISACLKGERVRYDGELIRDEFVSRLIELCDVISVCPEVSIGLSVPRAKIIVYIKNGEYRISQPETGKELTEEILKFSEDFLNNLPEIDGFILKSKSPSCGVSQTKVFRDPEGKKFYKRGKGLFAIKAIERFPLLPIEDELRLRDEEIRIHFLIRLLTARNLRMLREKARDIKDIIEFHKNYSSLLNAYSKRAFKLLERRLKNYKDENLQDILNEYYIGFLKALKRKRKININLLSEDYKNFLKNLKF